MSLFLQERIKEQGADDQSSDKKIVFTFPWIFNFPIQNVHQWMEEGTIAETFFATSYKMSTAQWEISLLTGFNTIVINNRGHGVWDGICYISYTLYYDTEMRFEYFSSTKIQMNVYGGGFETPDGYMTKFIEAANKKKFSKCVISVELHLPIKYFYQSSFIRNVFSSKIFDKFPDDYENNFAFEFIKKGDYTFECLDGTVLAQRVVLFTSSATLKKQLLSQRHRTFETLKYTVDVVKPIMIFFHTHCFKLPESFNFDFIGRLLHAIEYFEPIPNPNRKGEMESKIEEVLCKKFAKEKHDFNSLLGWLSFSCKYTCFQHGLTKIIYSLIGNEYYFKWQQTFPETARNMQNPLFHRLFEHVVAERNAYIQPAVTQFQLQMLGPFLVDEIFNSIDNIFENSLFTNIILQ